MKKTFSALLAAPLLASVVVAPSALAAPGGGAQVFKDSECLDFGAKGNVCFKGIFVHNETVTPSGNVNVVSNSRYQASGTFLGETFKSSGRDHFRILLKDGEPQVVSMRFRFTGNFGSVRCEGRYAFHLAHGVVRQERESVDCPLF